MPRGFLVKRLPSSKHSAPSSYRDRGRRYSDEDRSDSRSDSSSDHDNIAPTQLPLPTTGGGTQPAPAAHASPDSGFGSPTLLLYRSPAQFGSRNHFCDLQNADNSPLALTTRATSLTTSLATSAVPYLNPFDQFMVSLCTPPIKSSQTPAPPPPSPHKRRESALNSLPKGSRAPKKSKAVRRLTFDEDKTSPVSGTIIRDFDDVDEPQNTSLVVVRKGDIDPSFNLVEATEEAKAEIAKIDNRIGDYICQLCKKCYDDAFGLAQHRCSRIIHVEYRCPECDKVFNCPANLASHRRWHKPRPNSADAAAPTSRVTPLASTILPPPPRLLPTLAQSADLSDSEASNSSSSHPCSPNGDDAWFECDLCNKKFRRQNQLRKHLQTHGRLDASADKCDDFGADVGGAFACKFCPIAFATSPGLTRHINKLHPSETRQVILLQVPHS